MSSADEESVRYNLLYADTQIKAKLTCVLMRLSERGEVIRHVV